MENHTFLLKDPADPVSIIPRIVNSNAIHNPHLLYHNHNICYVLVEACVHLVAYPLSMELNKRFSGYRYFTALVQCHTSLIPYPCNPSFVLCTSTKGILKKSGFTVTQRVKASTEDFSSAAL